LKIGGKRGRKAGAIYFPRNSLQEAIKIPKAIWDSNAGNPFAIGDLAEKVGYSPMSGSFRELIRSSTRYGLTEGSWQHDITKTISLSTLGSSIVAPSAGEDMNAAKLKALLTPDLFKEVLESINGKVIPPEDVFENTLMRIHHLDKADAESCYKVIKKNIEELGISQDLQEKIYLRLDKLGSVSIIKPSVPQSEEGEEEKPPTPPQELKPVVKQIFVAHGKNKRPLEQLERILNRFKVNYKVAEEEPHRGRPIGVKVAKLMKLCTSGIFIFTADEEAIDVEGKKYYRPSDNVVFELGAASVLYGNKIVILKEDIVTFASDFSDIGYISFEKDKLDAKAADLMVELIALGFLQVMPT
jgi:hypothetical protein